MARAHLWLILAFATGCGYFKKTPESSAKSDDRVADLRASRLVWVEALMSASDAVTGAPAPHDCDDALWAGEALAGGQVGVKLEAFEKTPGAISRSPVDPCTPSSRDMVLGYAYGAWRTGDLGALQRLYDYGNSHAWEMSADAALSLIDPSAIGILSRGIDALSGGKDKRGFEDVPPVCLMMTKDYEQHLMVLEALLAGEVQDRLEGEGLHLLHLPQGCVDVLKSLAAGSPRDALFAAAAGVYTGDMGLALTLLLDPGYQAPSYVRGADDYLLVHKVFAASVVLRRYPEAKP